MAAFFTAEEVSDEVEARMQGILIANGYETDIGRVVYLGRRVIDDEEIPASVIVEAADDVEGQTSDMADVDAQFVLYGYVACDQDRPNKAAHRVARDIKRAMFTTNGKPDWTWGRRVKGVRYLGKEFGPRADGAAFVLCVVSIGVKYVETLATP